MRKNHFQADLVSDFKEFNAVDFTKQQDLMKNVLSKKYDVTLATSFNERTVYGVIGKNEQNQYFFAIDKSQQGNLTVEELKAIL